MPAETTTAAPDAGVPVATDLAASSTLDWLLAGLQLLILFAFVSSLVKWISLLRGGVRLFGDKAILPARQRARPYWNPLCFFFFFAVLLVANLQLNQWLGTPPPSAPAIDADAVAMHAVAPAITVTQLLLSSASMVVATLATMWLVSSFRPPLRRTESGREERPRVGWLPRRGDITLGFTAAWLILPPTMLMMAAVSVMQKYSHPVLDVLQPDGADSAPDFGVFAALFFTTAIITPLVEEFWFRGMLQGGLQRIADAVTDTRRWQVAAIRDDETSPAEPLLNDSSASDSLPSDSSAREADATAAVDEASGGNPYAAPQSSQSLSTTQPELADPGRAIVPEVVRDFATRSDWTPTAIWPIVVTSVMFAIMHWGQGLAPIPLFFLSMGLGYLYRQTGSLVPSIVVHFTLNGFTMSATLLELLR